MCLKSAIVSPRYIVEEMLCCSSHKGDTILELMADADDLMLIHLKNFIGIILPLKKLDEDEDLAITTARLFILPSVHQCQFRELFTP